MAPEYIAKGRLTEKADVYSFGVLVIEIVTGVENNKYQSETTYETLVTNVNSHNLAYIYSCVHFHMNVHTYFVLIHAYILFFFVIIQAWKHFQSNAVLEIIDKSMEHEDIEEIERVVQIGLLCTQESPILRPNMTRVVQMLRHKDIELATPSKPPFTDEEMELSYFGLDR